MLPMSTVQVGNPIPFVILMESDYWLIHVVERSGPVSLNTSSPFDKWIAPSFELRRSGLRL